MPEGAGTASRLMLRTLRPGDTLIAIAVQYSEIPSFDA